MEALTILVSYFDAFKPLEVSWSEGYSFMKILLIENDLSVGQYLSNELTAHRYTVDLASDGHTGLALATQGEYAIILLGFMVSDLDGLSVCRQLRRQGCQTPILMLTANNLDEDVVTGLDAGADDCVTKFCEPSLLIARIRALLRRQSSAMLPPILTWGALHLDPNLLRVTYQQQVIALSPKEYSLLELFLRYPQRIFSRSTIINHLWSVDECPTDAAVTNLIKDLRRRLKSAGMTEDLIETVYRLGYRLRVPPKKEKIRQEEQTNDLKEIVEPSILSAITTPLTPTITEEALTTVLPVEQFQALQLKAIKTDSLTQVANRQYFDEFLEQMWQHLTCEQAPVSLIFCDLDYFKFYNDSHGYQAGNSCLQQIANVVQECVNCSQNLVARYGGDEFAIFLPNLSLDGALQIAQRIQQAIYNLQIPHPSSLTSHCITLSLGISGTTPNKDKLPRNLIVSASQALYAAKARGRNTYCLYPSL